MVTFTQLYSINKYIISTLYPQLHITISSLIDKNPPGSLHPFRNALSEAKLEIKILQSGHIPAIIFNSDQ